MAQVNDRILAAAIRRLQKEQLSKAFDPTVPESRPNKKQQAIFDDIGKVQQRFVTAGNQSGKSTLVAREIAWILNRDHPTWTRPREWGDGPLLIIVAGQSRSNMEIELWEKKLAPFLDRTEWKETRSGGILTHVSNKLTGDRVLFLSHSDSSESNRRMMQGYVAHYVWLDEMPSHISILEELQRRVDAKKGYLVASFTPKFRNEAIRRVIEHGRPPVIKQYKMSKLDNPLYADRIEEELQKMEGYSEAYKRAVLYGEWYTGDSAVYEWHDSMMHQPENYSAAWRHVEAVDPALKSKFGYTLWAEDPQTGVWYLIRADYIEGIYDPEEMIQEVKKRSKGYNIVRRVSDASAPWFNGVASKSGLTYMTPYAKNNNRKEDLIKNLQSALSGGKIKIAPHCDLFLEEIQSCQWRENSDKIINSSSYHVLDCAQYFVDCKPIYDSTFKAQPWHEALRRGNEARKKAEIKIQKISKGGRLKPVGAWARRAHKGRMS